MDRSDPRYEAYIDAMEEAAPGSRALSDRYLQLEQIFHMWSVGYVHDWGETYNADLGGYPRDLLMADPERLYEYARKLAAEG